VADPRSFILPGGESCRVVHCFLPPALLCYTSSVAKSGSGLVSLTAISHHIAHQVFVKDPGKFATLLLQSPSRLVQGLLLAAGTGSKPRVLESNQPQVCKA